MLVERKCAGHAGEAHTCDGVANIGTSGVFTGLFDGPLEHVDGIVTERGEGVRRFAVIGLLV